MDNMVNSKVTCFKCKKVFKFKEPKGYDGTEYMPDGELSEKEWTCSECL